MDYNEVHVEYMRERLIQAGAGGCFGSTNTPAYWEAEQIIETCEARYPQIIEDIRVLQFPQSF